MSIDRALLESSELEFKLVVPDTESLARLLVAMANTKGGKIAIGIRDGTREVVGIVPNQRVEEHIANVAAEVCSPIVEYQLSYETIEQKTILLISVEAGHAKPYYIKKLGLHQGVFIRVGSSCRLADRETVKRLTREGQNVSFDSEKSRLTKDTLSVELLESYLQKRELRLGTVTKRITEDLLHDLDLLSEEKLTVAGALLFAQSPQKDPHLSGAIIRAARFKGEDRGEFLDHQDIGGPLSNQIEESVKFILRNISRRSLTKGITREDSYDYPIKVLRELITNAVVHRDYSITQESIQLAVFDNRIEVTSPGGLPGTLTVENMINRQHSRNPIIAKRMFEMGFLEAWGLGIDTIVEWSKLQRKKEPVLQDKDDQFTCIIYTAPQHGVVFKGARDLSEKEEQILTFFDEHKSLSNRDLRDLCSLSKTQVRTILIKLLKKKFITQKGQGPSAMYIRRDG